MTRRMNALGRDFMPKHVDPYNNETVPVKTLNDASFNSVTRYFVE
jgi:hypothetical protein